MFLSLFSRVLAWVGGHTVPVPIAVLHRALLHGPTQGPGSVLDPLPSPARSHWRLQAARQLRPDRGSACARGLCRGAGRGRPAAGTARGQGIRQRSLSGSKIILIFDITWFSRKFSFIFRSYLFFWLAVISRFFRNAAIIIDLFLSSLQILRDVVRVLRLRYGSLSSAFSPVSKHLSDLNHFFSLFLLEQLLSIRASDPDQPPPVLDLDSMSSADRSNFSFEDSLLAAQWLNLPEEIKFQISDAMNQFESADFQVGTIAFLSSNLVIFYEGGIPRACYNISC